VSDSFPCFVFGSFKFGAVLTKVTDLGTIVAVFVTFDFLKDSKSGLLVVNAEGSCFVFDLKKDLRRPVLTFEIPWNVTCVTLLDFMGREEPNLVIACHDGGSSSDSVVHVLAVDELTLSLVRRRNQTRTKFEVQMAVPFPGAAASMSFTKVVNQGPRILVGLQYGGVISIGSDGSLLKHRFASERNEKIPADEVNEGDFGLYSFPAQKKLLFMNKPVHVHGFHVGEEMLHSDHAKSTDSEAENSSTLAGLMAFSMGGKLRLERLSHKSNHKALYNEFLFEEDLDRQIFALKSLDINQNGAPDVVSCTWDGLTCMYDLQSNVVRYQFDGRVQGFHAGKYTHKPGLTSTCFVYVTFAGKISVFTDVAESIQSIPAHTLITCISERCNLSDLVVKIRDSCDPETREKIEEDLRHLKESNRAMAFYARYLREGLNG